LARARVFQVIAGCTRHRAGKRRRKQGDENATGRQPWSEGDLRSPRRGWGGVTALAAVLQSPSRAAASSGPWARPRPAGGQRNRISTRTPAGRAYRAQRRSCGHRSETRHGTASGPRVADQDARYLAPVSQAARRGGPVVHSTRTRRSSSFRVRRNSTSQRRDADGTTRACGAFAQKFGDLAADWDGLIAVGVVGGKIATSRRARQRPVAHAER